MYVGHALLAFALVGGLARLTGRGDREILVFAALGACYGLLPDVDLVYTVYAVAESGPTGIFPTTKHVWTESWVIHRTLTHSLLVGSALVVAVLGAAVVVPRSLTDRPPVATRVLGGGLAGLLTVALLSIAFVADGRLGMITMSLLVTGAIGLTLVGRRHGVSVTWLGCVAAVGLLLHPLGDLWMGRPPVVFYPVAPKLAFPPILFASDPTIHFVTAFMIELGLAWASILLWISTTDRAVWTMIRPAAALGLVACGAFVLVPPPTFTIAYQFSAGVLGLGLVSAVGTLLLEGTSSPSTSPMGRTDPQLWSHWPDAVVTGMATTTLGLVSYLLVYLMLSGV